MIHITKVVTRNVVLDMVAKLQNIVGMNIRSYEKMISKAMKEIEEEIEAKDIKLKWYRYEISSITGNAMAVTLYGEEIGRPRSDTEDRGVDQAKD